jgi:hypothetical protein
LDGNENDGKLTTSSKRIVLAHRMMAFLTTKEFLVTEQPTCLTGLRFSLFRLSDWFKVLLGLLVRWMTLFRAKQGVKGLENGVEADALDLFLHGVSID